MSRLSAAWVERAFLRHPRSVGENYAEHARIATDFALGMLTGGVKCLIHAAVPALFETAASDRVRRLHAELERRRRQAGDCFPDYVI